MHKINPGRQITISNDRNIGGFTDQQKPESNLQKLTAKLMKLHLFYCEPYDP